MVEGSDLTLRCQLDSQLDICWTPMYNTFVLQKQKSQIQQIIKEINYEKQNFKHKIVLQFATHDCQQLEDVGSQILQYCTPDYVEVNMGCSQDIAKKGQYGSYLTTNLQLCLQLIGILDSLCKKLNKTTQISIKTRLFDNLLNLLYQAIIKYNVTLITVRGIQTFKTVGITDNQNDNLKVIDVYNQLKIKLSEYQDFNRNILFISNGGISGIKMHKKLLQYVDGTMSATGLFQNCFIYNEQQPINDVQQLIEYLQNDKFKVSKYFSTECIYKFVNQNIQLPYIYKNLTKEIFYNKLKQFQDELNGTIQNKEYKLVKLFDDEDIQVGMTLIAQQQYLRNFKGDFIPIFYDIEITLNNLIQVIIFAQNYIYLKNKIQTGHHTLQAHTCRLIGSSLMNTNIDIRKIISSFTYEDIDRSEIESVKAQQIIYVCIELIKRIQKSICYM